MQKFEEQIKSLDPDLQHYIFQKGFSSGLEHQQPSPKTLEMFGKIEQKLDNIHNFIFGFEGEGGLNKKIDSIEIQTKKTNGRVSKLEIWQAGVVATCALLSVIGWYYVDKFDVAYDKVTVLYAQQK